MTTPLSLLASLFVFAPAADCHVGAHDTGRATACEVRTFDLAPTGALAIRNDVSGGVEVVGWDRDAVAVRAVVRAYETDGRPPEALLAATTIATDGNRLRNETAGGGWVEVRYEVRVPRGTDLDVQTNNGSLRVEGVHGTLDLVTNNGALDLAGLSGDVTARTNNGAVSVVVRGATWVGAGLSVATRNGPVRLVVPEAYDAVVDAATRYGSIGGDRAEGVRPGAETSRVVLGAGGPTLSIRTTAGDVLVTRG